MLIGPTGNSSFLRFRGRAIAPLVATLVALLILLAAVPAGAENGDKTLTIPRQELIAAMRRDLTYTRRVMRDQQLV